LVGCHSIVVNFLKPNYVEINLVDIGYPWNYYIGGEALKMVICEDTGNERNMSRVQKIWEKIAQEFMHRLAARDLPPGAISELLVLCCCKRRCWCWKLSDSGRKE